MASATMKHWRLNAQLLSRQVGWPVLLALALLSVGAVIDFFLLPTWQQRSADAKQVLAQSRHTTPQTENEHLLNERLQAFRARLVAPGDRAELLRPLFAVAERQGLVLSQADYHWQVDEDGDYQRLQVSLPVVGSYPAIRAFVDGVLVALPAASLNEVSFQRNSIKASAVDARLKFTIFLRTAN